MQVYLISLCCPETSKSNFCFSEVSYTSFGGFLQIRIWFWMRQVFCLFSHAAHFLKLEVALGDVPNSASERAFPIPAPCKFLPGTPPRGPKQPGQCPQSPSPHSLTGLLVAPSPETPQQRHCLASLSPPPQAHSTIVSCVSTQVVLKTKLTTICVFQNNASLYQAESLPFLSFV